MKFKDWFSFSAIKNEAKKVTWLKKKDLAKNTATVFAFCFVLGVFFYLSDAVIALILRFLGLS